jgi:phosphoglycolate phosphatase
MSDLKLILFDCDGTLVDGQHMILSAMKVASLKMNIEYPGDEASRRIVGLSLTQALETVFPQLADEKIEEVKMHFIEHFQHLRTLPDQNEPLYDGIKEMLHLLNDKGYLLGVATGKSMRGLKHTIANNDLEDLFVTLNTADCGAGKPDPAMIKAAMRDTGVRPENLYMIGDTTFDMEMAQNAGVKSVGVSWGYHEVSELNAFGATYIIDHISELLEILEKD